jgi:acyl-CoA oxidase
VLMLQVARFLFKSVVALQKGAKLPPSAEYLQQLSKGKVAVEVKEELLNCPFFVNQLLKTYSCIQVKNMALKLSQGIKEGMSEKEAWDTYAGLSLNDAAIAHSVVTIHTFFLEALMKVECPKVKAVLTKLCLLFGLEKLIDKASRVY